MFLFCLFVVLKYTLAPSGASVTPSPHKTNIFINLYTIPLLRLFNYNHSNAARHERLRKQRSK